HPSAPDYPSYLDRWGAPFGYFSAHVWNAQAWLPPAYDMTHCGDIGAMPYVNVPINDNSFQLICAGRNKRFGQAGGVWTPSTASQVYPQGSDGCDDITNFASVRLGARQ